MCIDAVYVAWAMLIVCAFITAMLAFTVTDWVRRRWERWEDEEIELKKIRSMGDQM